MRSSPLAGGWGSVGPVVVCRKGVMALVRWRVHLGVGLACGGTWVRGLGGSEGGRCALDLYAVGLGASPGSPS